MDKHVLIANGVFDARVCSEGNYDEALEFIQNTNPAGTSLNWQKHDEGAFAPAKCAEDPKRTHYMFQC